MFKAKKGYNLTVQANNIFIGYDDIGEGDVPIIFLHGFPLDKSTWQNQLEFFKKTNRIIACNVRSFGNSTHDDEEISMDLLADDLIAFMDALHIKYAIICGLSMGGYIALNAVGRFSDRFLGLVLCNTKSSEDSEESKAIKLLHIKQINEKGIHGFTGEVISKLFHKDTVIAKKVVVKETEILIRSNSEQAITNGLVVLANREKSCHILNTINIPTLIVCGKEDDITPVESSQFLHENIKDSTLEIIESAGHLSNLDQPEEFNRILQRFLEVNPLFLWDLDDEI